MCNIVLICMCISKIPSQGQFRSKIATGLTEGNQLKKMTKPGGTLDTCHQHPRNVRAPDAALIWAPTTKLLCIILFIYFFYYYVCGAVIRDQCTQKCPRSPNTSTPAKNLDVLFVTPPTRSVRRDRRGGFIISRPQTSSHFDRSKVWFSGRLVIIRGALEFFTPPPCREVLSWHITFGGKKNEENIEYLVWQNLHQ